jgi:hypothetical protein
MKFINTFFFFLQQEFHAVDGGIHVRCVCDGGTGSVGSAVHDGLCGHSDRPG